MDPLDLCLLGVSDSSLNNVKTTTTTQFGGLVGLVEDEKVIARVETFMNQIDFWSKRQRRVVRSTFSGELYSFSFMLDRMIVVLQILQESGISLKRKLALTDCASVLQCLRASNPKCTEKRHLVEVALVKEI